MTETLKVYRKLKENDQKILESLSPLPIFSSQLGQYEDTDTSWLQ